MKCKHCNGSIEVTMGRRPTYCSGKCRQAAYRLRKEEARGSIPKEMAEARRWVRCDGKVPTGKDGRRLQWSKEENWLTFMEAKNADYGDGFGFIMGDGFGVIDLDDCFEDDGSLAPLAARVLEENPGAWAERSVSGQGLHVWGRMKHAVGYRQEGIEVYSFGRFIRVTGNEFQAGEVVLPELWV